MTHGKSAFVLYHDMRQPLERLSDEQRGKLFLAILNYSELGIVPDFRDGAVDMAFAFMKNSIDRDSAVWERKSLARSEAGKRGGLATQERNRLARQCEANQAIASNAIQNETNQAVPVPVPNPIPVPVNYIGDNKRIRQSERPSVEEIRAYCLIRNNGIDPEAFFDYYNAGGWTDKDGQPVNWKQKLIMWEANGIRQGNGSQAQNRNLPVRNRSTAYYMKEGSPFKNAVEELLRESEKAAEQESENRADSCL